MILRIEIPQELIRQDAEIVIKVSNRNNALGYVIENGSEHDALQIAKEDTNACPMLGEYVRELTQRLYKNGKYRSADIYMCTLRSFMRFRKEKDLLISQLDSLIMEDYESYLRKSGLTLNTISFYMKRLRSTTKPWSNMGWKTANPSPTLSPRTLRLPKEHLQRKTSIR